MEEIKRHIDVPKTALTPLARVWKDNGPLQRHGQYYQVIIRKRHKKY